VSCETCRVYLHCPTHPDALKCACGKAATVILRYLPRPVPLFGSAIAAPVCPSCYPETVKAGKVLSQQCVTTP
jgi:hypothetical protein